MHFFFVIKSSHILVKLKYYCSQKSWTLCNITDAGQESVSGVNAERDIAKFDTKASLIYAFTDDLEKKIWTILIIEKSLNFAENRTKIESHVNFEPHLTEMND